MTLLAGFTTYVILDTFVIERRYEVVVPADNAETRPNGGDNTAGRSESDNTEPSGDIVSSTDASNATPGEEGSSAEGSRAEESATEEPTTEEPTTEEPTTPPTIVTENSYSDYGISLTIDEIRYLDTDVIVVDIYTDDITTILSAFAENTYGRNIKEPTSFIANNNGAIFAINGDFYGARWSGYVIRNGVLYREEPVGYDQEDLVIYYDGTFEVIKEGEITARELLDKGAWQVFTFGPGLVVNGEINVSERQEVLYCLDTNQRTVIGQIADGHYVIVQADARTAKDHGLTLYQMAEFLKNLGVVTGYNLDGGGSSTIFFKGAVLNDPTPNGTDFYERSVSDIVYIKYRAE